MTGNTHRAAAGVARGGGCTEDRLVHDFWAGKQLAKFVNAVLEWSGISGR